MQAAQLVPTLFQLVPSKPGPAACATLERPHAPGAATYAFADPCASSSPGCIMWPIAAPVSSTAAPCALSIHVAHPVAVEMKLPPYMLLASTLLLAGAQQATQSIMHAIAAATPAPAAPSAEGKESHASALSDSLVVGTGGYAEASAAVPEVVVRPVASRICLFARD